MKKLILLSGAYKNAGDFLIEHRCFELLSRLLPNHDISIVKRRDAKEHLEDLFRADAIVCGGGPFYRYDLPDILGASEPQLFPKLFLLGGGIKFEEQPINGAAFEILSACENNGKGLSCRDIVTYYVLKKYGLTRINMTGCPAWYDVQLLDQFDLRPLLLPDKPLILISEPASPLYYPSVLDIITHLRSRFSDPDIRVIFHRGTGPDKETSAEIGEKTAALCRDLEKRSIPFSDISYNAEGLQEYENCDLHIGFRVHAHLYCLSRRKRSILIQEDSRGKGANETLGLLGINAYEYITADARNDVFQLFRRSQPTVQTIPNRTLIPELDIVLSLYEKTDYAYLTGAFRLMRKYYDAMKDFVLSIDS